MKEQEGGQNILNQYTALLQINFPSIFLILQTLFLNLTPKYFKFPPFQNFKQCIS